MTLQMWGRRANCLKKNIFFDHSSKISGTLLPPRDKGSPKKLFQGCLVQVQNLFQANLKWYNLYWNFPILSNFHKLIKCKNWLNSKSINVWYLFIGFYIFNTTLFYTNYQYWKKLMKSFMKIIKAYQLSIFKLALKRWKRMV